MSLSGSDIVCGVFWWTHVETGALAVVRGFLVHRFEAVWGF